MTSTTLICFAGHYVCGTSIAGKFCSYRRLEHHYKRAILNAVNKELIREISKTAVAKDKPAPISDSLYKV